MRHKNEDRDHTVERVMDCERIAREEFIEKYLRGQLEPALERDLQLHLLKCPECLALFEAYEAASVGLAARAPAIAQISAEQLRSAQRKWLRWPPSWGTAALAGALSLVVLAAIVGVGTGVIPRLGQGGNSGAASNQGTTKPGQLSQDIAALPPEEQRAVGEVIAQAKLTFPPELAELRPDQGALRKPPTQSQHFSLLSPVGEVIDDPQPIFQWQPLPEAQSYTVDVLGQGSSSLQSSPPLRETQWKPQQPLQRGHVYRWQVTAITADGAQVLSPKPPAPEAKFRVLQDSEADEIRRFRLSHPGSHLVLGILYARVGMLTAAANELRQVPQSDANNACAQELLKSIEKEQKSE